MGKKKSSKKFSSPINKATIELLQDIDQLNVCEFGADAASAVREGAILLGISRVDNDKEGDGFRYLIGLRRGTQKTPHLSLFF